MSEYNEFFTDSDKPFSENLNDALLILDAFNVTVPCKLPDMYSNGEFNSNLNIPRKAGVAIVTLKQVDDGITINNDSISGSGDVVFRIYPNFNSFNKWKSIVLTKSGDVTIGFKTTEGVPLSVSISPDGTISDNASLKVLQEIDVVLTLNDATISNILINFINNHNANRSRVNALLEASQLVNVNGTLVLGDGRAVSGNTVKQAIDTLSNLIQNGLATKENSSNKSTVLDDSTTKFPTCSAVKTITDSKSDDDHLHDSRYYTETETDDLLDTKVDKELGKDLSENDFTDSYKEKLDGIEAQATKTVVDANLSSTSTNPIQNKAVKNALDSKANTGHTHDKTSITGLVDMVVTYQDGTTETFKVLQ